MALSRINLNTTHSLTDHSRQHPVEALPVLVDLNWYGQVMTSENAGITASRSSAKHPLIEPDHSFFIL